MKLEKRSCDLCGGQKYEAVYSYPKKLYIQEEQYEWQVDNVVCNDCGYAYVTPVPSQSFFTKYFENKVSIFTGSKVDYSIPKRLHLIEKYQLLSNGKNFVEIGSNNCPPFLESISNIFENISTVEANKECPSTYNDIHELPENSADIIVSYLVMDNFVNPLDFLTRCAKTLTSRGYAIIEVPHLYLYSRYLTGLFSFEHLSHFSPNTLSCLAQKAGLSLVEISQEYSSRAFAFAAVFRKGEGDYRRLLPNSIERTYARNCIEEAKEKIISFQQKIYKVRSLLETSASKSEPIIIWGINDVCEILLEEFQLPSNCYLVDSDERKKKCLTKYQVYHPLEVKEHIRNTNLLVLNTPRHQSEILAWVHENVGKSFRLEQIETISLF